MPQLIGQDRQRIRQLERDIDGENCRISQLEANSRHRSPYHVAKDLARARGRRRKLQEELQQLKDA